MSTQKDHLTEQERAASARRALQREYAAMLHEEAAERARGNHYPCPGGCDNLADECTCPR